MEEPRTEPRTDSFKTLKAKLAAKGADNPAALAAWICRKKHGAAGLAKKAAAGRRKAAKGK